MSWRPDSKVRRNKAHGTDCILLKTCLKAFLSELSSSMWVTNQHPWMPQCHQSLLLPNSLNMKNNLCCMRNLNNQELKVWEHSHKLHTCNPLLRMNEVNPAGYLFMAEIGWEKGGSRFGTAVTGEMHEALPRPSRFTSEQ